MASSAGLLGFNIFIISLLEQRSGTQAPYLIDYEHKSFLFVYKIFNANKKI